MPQSSSRLLEPRKLPVQARSTASVDAILEATVQVLLGIGPERLTTTRVAARAGVSVGTLYQYFPNKGALLKAVLRCHFDRVAAAVEQVCREQRSRPLEEMVSALVTAFLAAKMRDPETSVALYAISSSVDGLAIVQQVGASLNRSIVAMLESSPEPLARDPHMVAAMLQGAMAGVSRRLLESGEPAKHLASVQQELIFLARAYVRAAAAGD